jgi:hypothetical protein
VLSAAHFGAKRGSAAAAVVRLRLKTEVRDCEGVGALRGLTAGSYKVQALIEDS